MNFLNRGGGINKNAAFMITEQGREKLQQFTADTNSQILVTLETNGSMSLKELSRATGVTVGDLERKVKILEGSGYITSLAGGGSDL